MSRLRTPIIKPRTQGGTFYTFGSALEDVGLNINELKNKVALSHYVLLNIPSFTASTFTDDVNYGDYTFAEHFQNYALNMETVLRNQETYNFAESLTVSERVFWKWMQKESFISFVKDEDENGNETGYYIDASTFTDDSVIKGFGLIAAGAQRTDAYGIYNETFVQIPSSYGQMKVLLKPVSDKNYYETKEDECFRATTKGNYIENVEASECNEDGTLHTGLSAVAVYDNDSLKAYTVDGEKEELCVEFALSELRKYYDDDTLSYNDLGIGANDVIRPAEVNGNFNFNAVLIYYSIYDSTGKNILATNAYGLLLLDSASVIGNETYQYPSFVKKQSGVNDAGNSYSFRINAKTSSVYSGDVKVTDNSTPAYAMSTDFNDTVRNLAVAVETLRSNANLISVMCDQNAAIKELAVKSLDKIDDIEKDIITLKTGKVKELKTSLLITDALSTNTLDSSLTIGDYGAIDGSVFTYETVKANKASVKDASVETLAVTKIDGTNKEILFGDYGKVSSNGLFTNTIFFDTETAETADMNAAEASNIIDSLTPKKDGNFVINTNKSSSMTASNNIGEVDSQSEVSGNDKLNVKTLLASLVKKVQSMELFDVSDASTDVLRNISDMLDDINSSVEDIKDTIDNLTGENGELENLDSRIGDVEDTVNTIDSSIGEIYNTIDDYSTSLAEIEDNVSDIASDVSTLVGSHNDIGERVSDLETAVNSIDSSISVIPNLDASIQSHDASVQAHDSSIQDLKDKLDAIIRFIGADVMTQHESLYDYVATIIS